MEINETLITNFQRTMKLNKFVTLESGLRPKGGVGGILDGIPSLGGEHLNADGGFIFEKIKYIPEDFFQMLNKGHIHPNDIIVVKDGATTGKISFVDNDFPHKRAVVNEHLFIVRVDPKMAFSKYVFYYLFSSEGQKQILSDFRGATIGGISRNFPQKVNVPIPPLPEQTQIANFLDRKTEQIDELIRIKERRIELLQEQRTALINQAVTKGLDPNVEMKPSGVEWIGEIPIHWDVKRLKYVANINMGQSPPSEEYNNDQVGTPFLQGNAEFGSHHPTPKIYCPTAKKYAGSGDILLSVRAPVGAINIANQEYGIGRGLCAIHPQANQLEHLYAKYLLKVVRTELHTIATGSTYDAVTVDEVSNITCVVPPFCEQTQIANFLDCKTKQIDELISGEQRKIELLKEYRQSLISEAVTGKIDVRNEA